MLTGKGGEVGMTEEERREMTRSNYTSQMNMLGYSADGNPEDMVEIVRCKNCKHRGNSERCVLSAISDEKDVPLFILDNWGDWFCADGKRR